MADLRIVGERDVRTLLKPADALALADTVLRDQAAGKSLLSTPSAMNLDAGAEQPRFKFKAAAVGAVGASGIRLIASRKASDTGQNTPRPENWTAVFDHDSGRLTGLVAQNWLSRLRTAAFGVAAVRPLVSNRPLTIGLFGTGNIAVEIVPLLDMAFDIAELRVNSRRPQRVADFVDEFSGALGDRIKGVADHHSVVDGADLIITLTESREPLVRPGWLKPGAVVCAMGSYNEFDHAALADIDRLIVDDPDYAAEMGEGGSWIRSGLMTRDSFDARIDATAADVVAGKMPGRLSPDDRVLAIVQGMAIGDIALAALALSAAASSDSGIRIELP